jgi:hypothetical protein
MALENILKDAAQGRRRRDDRRGSPDRGKETRRALRERGEELTTLVRRFSKSALAVLVLAWLPNYAVANEANWPTAAHVAFEKAIQAAIEKAKNCDDDAAIAFSQLNNENAEAIARTAFEKCKTLWTDADNTYKDLQSKWFARSVTEDDIKHNPYLLSGYTKDIDTDRVGAWKQAEIERLPVVVMETRLKNAPTH